MPSVQLENKKQLESNQKVILLEACFSPLSQITLNCTFHFLFKFATEATQSQQAENREGIKVPSLTAGQDKFKGQSVYSEII